MKKKIMFLNLSSVISLKSFAIFSEYLISISIIYTLITVTIIAYSIYGLTFQKALGECIALILCMATFLIINDCLLMYHFSNFNNSIVSDSFGVFSKIIICLFSALYFWIIANLLERELLISFEYLLIILFSILGLLFMCISNDFLTTYLSIELSSLAFYVLTSFRKTSNYSIESSITYFITGAISSAFFLLGSSLVYGFTGSINFYDFYDLFERFNIYFYSQNTFFNSWNMFQSLIFNELFNYNLLEFGLFLILFSLFIKLALAPFHIWSLDVYEGAPTSSAFFFAVITKLSIFVLLTRLCYTSFFSLKNCWQNYSFWTGVLSIFVGSFGGLKQRKLKTLLAYSSISHMGYSLVAFSTSTVLGIQMFLFYLIVYMISGLSTWQLILIIKLKISKHLKKNNKELNDFLLLKNSNFILAFLLSILLFSIGGIPPLLGFISKMNIILSITEISFYFMALITVLLSIISTFYYVRIIKVFYFENNIVGKLYYPIKSTKILLSVTFIFLLFFCFLNPTILYLIIYLVTLCFL